jgi:glucan phosphoethanolaminetransferase (alkaline phosphatase superfamily)
MTEPTSPYETEITQQRVQLSRLYEQQESLVKNIEGLKQIISTLEYVVNKEVEKSDQKLQNILEKVKDKQSNTGTK